MNATRPDPGHPEAAESGSVPLGPLPGRVDVLMADAGHSVASRAITAATLARFVGFAEACGVEDLGSMPVDLVAEFVSAPSVDGSGPSAATSQLRRSVLRLTYRLLAADGVAATDPTWNLSVPPRVGRRVRPLKDVEAVLVREASLVSLAESRLPTLVALAEATATAAEIARVRLDDLDLDDGRVRLSGCRDTVERSVALTDWGSVQIRRRTALLDTCDSDRRLIYRGADCRNAGQASVTVALRRLLVKAGLGDEPDVGVASIRAWAGRRLFESSGRIEVAARELGCRSLDVAVRIMNLDWHGEQ
jgi:site-specific recombinase XerC